MREKRVQTGENPRIRTVCWQFQRQKIREVARPPTARAPEDKEKQCAHQAVAEYCDHAQIAAAEQLKTVQAVQYIGCFTWNKREDI